MLDKTSGDSMALDMWWIASVELLSASEVDFSCLIYLRRLQLSEKEQPF
jgi:hypothetical protein